MSASRDMELSRNYEDILERRAALLWDLQTRVKQQKSKRRQQEMEFHTAVERNRRLREDVKKTEDRLRQSQVTDPDVLLLETQYWGSVEDQMPSWKSLLLGQGPDRTDPSLGRPPRKAKQKSTVTGKDSSLPPLPRPWTHSGAQGSQDRSKGKDKAGK